MDEDSLLLTLRVVRSLTRARAWSCRVTRSSRGALAALTRLQNRCNPP